MTDDRPGPFPSARAALGWYWRTRDSRAAPRAIDPSRQCISGSTDGAVKLYGQWVDAEGTYALCALCLKEFTREEERVLRLGWFGSATRLELSGYDARTIRARLSPLARRATAWLRERSLLTEGR